MPSTISLYRFAAIKTPPFIIYICVFRTQHCSGCGEEEIGRENEKEAVFLRLEHRSGRTLLTKKQKSSLYVEKKKSSSPFIVQCSCPCVLVSLSVVSFAPHSSNIQVLFCAHDFVLAQSSSVFYPSAAFRPFLSLFVLVSFFSLFLPPKKNPHKIISSLPGIFFSNISFREN